MSPLIIRVVPTDLAWRVISDPCRQRLVDVLCTRERAIEHALEIAGELARIERRPVRVRVEGRDGRVDDDREAA